MTRTGGDVIIIHKKKQVSKNEKMMVLFTAIKRVCDNSYITFKMKSKVAKATCSQVAYDYGFKSSFVTSQLPVCEGEINSTIEGNSLLGSNLNLLSSDHSGSPKYVDYIEHIHSNYIQNLFRDAQNGGHAIRTSQGNNWLKL